VEVPRRGSRRPSAVTLAQLSPQEEGPGTDRSSLATAG